MPSMKRTILIAPLCLACLLAVSAPGILGSTGGEPPLERPAPKAATSKPTLAPGEVIRLIFPDLPPTLFAMRRGQIKPEPAVTIRLPDNYAPDKRFPLLVWLDINDGGVGAEIGQPMRIVGRSDYIVANFPLFRRSFDPSAGWGITVGVDDAPLMTAAYTTIMDRIRATIPNIDPSASIIGGFPNRSHAPAAPRPCRH